MAKLSEKQKAIGLRKNGLSYAEILKEIPVAKSTLSLWLRSVGLSKRQKQRLTDKKLASAKRGGEAKKKQRIELAAKIRAKAVKEIGRLSKKDLWLAGIILYWAEGSKEKEGRPGSGVRFCNSDALMVKVFLKWLKQVFNASMDDLGFALYIHENNQYRLNEVKKYWADKLEIDFSCFKKVYFKKHKPKTNRKNIKESYYGLVEVKVYKSSKLLRRIEGWIEGLRGKYCRVV